MPSTPTSTAISSHLVVRPDWLAKRRETVLEPDHAVGHQLVREGVVARAVYQDLPAVAHVLKLADLERVLLAALLQGGSPATPDDLRKRFDTFMNERCKGKDASKLRFVVD